MNKDKQEVTCKMMIRINFKIIKSAQIAKIKQYKMIIRTGLKTIKSAHQITLKQQNQGHTVSYANE